MAQPEPWHLDKRIPIAIIFALLTQTAGAVWWASAMSSNVAALREADADLKAADVQIRLDATAREARLRAVEQGAGRMEAQLDNIAAGVQRLTQQMDRLLEARP